MAALPKKWRAITVDFVGTFVTPLILAMFERVAVHRAVVGLTLRRRSSLPPRRVEAIEKADNKQRDFVGCFVQREVSGFQKVHFCIRYIVAVRCGRRRW